MAHWKDSAVRAALLVRPDAQVTRAAESAAPVAVEASLAARPGSHQGRPAVRAGLGPRTMVATLPRRAPRGAPRAGLVERPSA
ncbi:hypothetical protein ACWCPM_01055 [Streptomyces sp. NPDC002309]